MLLATGLAAFALALMFLLWRPLDRPASPPPLARPPASEPIRIFDTAIVRSVVALPPLDQKQIYAEEVAYSPDGRALAIAQINGQVLLWDAQRLETAPRALDAERWRIEAMAFSPDSATLATADAQGRVRLWRVSDGSLITTLRKHYQGVTGVQFSPDGKLLATASTDGAIRLWDLASGQVQEDESYYHETTGLQVSTYSLHFIPDGSGLLLGLRDGSIVRRRLDTGRDEERVEAHDGPVIGLTISSDGTLLASTGDGRVRLWRVADLAPIASIALPASAASGAEFSPNGQMLAVTVDRSVTLWAVDDGRPLAELHRDELLHGLAFSPDGRFLVVTASAAPAPIWQLSLAQGSSQAAP